VFNFTKKLLFARQFKMEKGRVFLLNTRISFFQPSTFAYMLINSKNRFQLSREMYYASKKSFSETFINHVKTKYKPKTRELIEIMFNLAMMSGWGDWSLVKLDLKEKHSVIRMVNSPISELIKKEKIKIECPVDSLARGMHAGAAKIIFQTDVDAVETRCIALGDPFCEFVLKPSIKWKKEPDKKLYAQLFPVVDNR